MGLDQTLYRMRKPTPTEMCVMEERMLGQRPPAWQDEDEDVVDDLLLLPIVGHLTEDLKDISERVIIPVSQFESSLLFAAHNLPNTSRIVGTHMTSNGDTTFSISVSEPEKDIEQNIVQIHVNEDDLENLYSREYNVEHYAVHAKEIHDWRKAQDIQDFLGVPNCSYTILSEETVRHIMDMDDSFEPPLLKDDEVYVYHPWW